MGLGENKTIAYPVNFSYDGKTDDAYTGNIFYIGENWASYESMLKSTLSLFGIPLAGPLLGILIIIMGGVYSTAKREQQGERRTIYFIARPAEWLASFISSPLFWLFELACGTVLVLVRLFFTLSDISPGIGCGWYSWRAVPLRYSCQ